MSRIIVGKKFEINNIIPIKVKYPTYGIIVPIVVVLLIFIINNTSKITWEIDVFILIIMLLTVRIKRLQLRNDLRKNLKERNLSYYYLNFHETFFSYGYEDSINTKIKYDFIIKYTLKKQVLTIQTGYFSVQIYMDCFTDEETKKIIDITKIWTQTTK